MIDRKTIEVAEKTDAGDDAYWAFHSFIAGAEYMRDRILGMLRGDSASMCDSGYDYSARPKEWADWIEKELKK